jgi:hypothetical protein
MKCTGMELTSGTTLDVNGNRTVTVFGDWTNAGTFVPSTGTVALSGTGTQTLSGNTGFYNLSATASAARTINFTAGTTQTIASGGSLTLTGADSNLLTLASTTPGTQWNLRADNEIAAQTIQYVNVSDCNAGPFGTYAELVAADGTSTDGGNNDNWDFGMKDKMFLEFF